MSAAVAEREPKLATARQDRLAREWEETLARLEAPMPDGLERRHRQMLMAFREAHRLGLTRRELAENFGDRWRATLRELQRAGVPLREDRSRYGKHHVFRWVLDEEPDYRNDQAKAELGF